jgi:hypothetical protein
MQDVDARILLDGEDETLAVRDLDCSESLNRQFGHSWFLLCRRTSYDR